MVIHIYTSIEEVFLHKSRSTLSIRFYIRVHERLKWDDSTSFCWLLAQTIIDGILFLVWSTSDHIEYKQKFKIVGIQDTWTYHIVSHPCECSPMQQYRQFDSFSILYSRSAIHTSQWEINELYSRDMRWYYTFGAQWMELIATKTERHIYSDHLTVKIPIRDVKANHRLGKFS